MLYWLYFKDLHKAGELRRGKHELARRSLFCVSLRQLHCGRVTRGWLSPVRCSLMSYCFFHLSVCPALFIFHDILGLAWIDFACHVHVHRSNSGRDSPTYSFVSLPNPKSRPMVEAHGGLPFLLSFLWYLSLLNVALLLLKAALGFDFFFSYKTFRAVISFLEAVICSSIIICIFPKCQRDILLANSG